MQPPRVTPRVARQEHCRQCCRCQVSTHLPPCHVPCHVPRPADEPMRQERGREVQTVAMGRKVCGLTVGLVLGLVR